jgi:hypothetical protein
MNQVPHVYNNNNNNENENKYQHAERKHAAGPEQAAKNLRHAADEKKRIGTLKKEAESNFNELQAKYIPEMLKRGMRFVQHMVPETGEVEYWTLTKCSKSNMKAEHRAEFWEEYHRYISQLTLKNKPLPSPEQACELEKKFKARFEERTFKLVAEKTRPKHGIKDLLAWQKFETVDGQNQNPNMMNS